tara:strand:- start:7301 stop:9247 length:1947 start_codon:yes stop_codon:yes gene_type:complete
MDDKSKISQEELFAAQERLRYIKESNLATEESISLAGDLASMIQQEHDYLIGINEDKRTSSDLSREILAESQTIAKAEKEKLSLYKKGNVDEAAKLGVIIKQAKARIKEKTTLAASMKEIEEADKKRIAANEQIAKLIGISASELNKSKGAATKAFLVKQGASAWGMIKNIIMETSKLISGLQKDLGITDDEAAKLQDHFAKIGDDADRLGINLISVQKAFNTLNAQFGTAATVIRDDIVVETAKLMKFYEMSAESAKSFAQFSLISGKNAAVVTAEARKAVVEGEKERGVRVDIRKVLDQTGKVTGQIRAQLGANPAAIAKAVTVAKQFAMELQQVAKAGDSLLNFEQSISAELEAELLTGKQLNLEKARLAALTGDYETLTKEIAENAGSFLEFSQMNVLQQRSLAAALGMSVDEISEMLIGEQSLAELAQEARDAGDEDLAKSLEKRDLAQQFADIQEAIMGILVENSDKVLEIVEFLVNAASQADVLKAVIKGIAAVKFAGIIAQVASLVATLAGGAAAAGAMSSAMTLGLGAIAIAAGIAAIYTAYQAFKPVKLAAGGMVMPSAGGTLATIGEGGQPEAVIPLNRAAEMGFGGNIDYDKMAEAFSKARINVKTAVTSNSFDSKSATSEDGDLVGDLKYDTPFA